jgi:hypothetical protein
MAFGKPKVDLVGTADRVLDPSNTNDKRIILEFERELEPYLNNSKKTLTLFKGTQFEITLTGVRLYMHEKGIYMYTERHKTGAVGWDGLHTPPYAEFMRKYAGLQKLWGQRAYMELQEAERVASI